MKAKEHGAGFASRRWWAGCVILLAGCAGFAEEVCTRETAISEAVVEAADYFGPVGDVAGAGVNLLLGVLCGAVDVTCEAVDGVGDVLGIAGEPEPES